MRPCTHLQATLAASVILLAPAGAAAGMSDVFSPGPRLDLAVELDYRSRYLSVDDMERDAPPPDRVGRERLGDAKARVAREYVRMLTDRLAETMLGSVPVRAELERRYDELTTFRVFRSESIALARTGAAGREQTGRESTSGTGLAVESVAPVERRTADVLAVRFRLGGGAGRLTPAVELTHRAFRGRLTFDPFRHLLEVKLSRRLGKSLDLEVMHAESFHSTGSQLRLSISLLF